MEALVEKVNTIDAKIREYDWFDMTVFRYDGHRLTIVGSIDLSYYHRLEIIFEDVFFLKCHFHGWSSDTSEPVFIIPDNGYELNVEYEIEQGYQLFTFKAEDMKNDVIIAAKDVHYSDDIVYYYYKEELKRNERLADFVKTKE